MSLPIESADVVRLIQQFLREQGLHHSLAAIEDETGIQLSALDRVDALMADIQNGNWAVVLRTLAHCHVEDTLRFDLYEHVILECLDMDERETARTLLRQSDVADRMKERDMDRYLRLESLLSRTSELVDVYGGKTRQQRRDALAEEFGRHVQSVPEGRLLTLLTHALRWMHRQGMIAPELSYDLFQGVSTATVQDDHDQLPVSRFASIPFGKKSCPESACFASDGSFLVTGTIDGFIEVWDPMTGKLRKDLKYQAEDKVMSMKGAVLGLAISRKNHLLASASDSGQIKVWQVENGQCIKTFEQAHTQGITSLAFHPDGTQVLSASFDGTIRLFGLKSGRMLKEFRGHTNFVNQAIFNADASRILSASSDGTVKIWNTKTSECIQTISPDEDSGGAAVTVHQVRFLPHQPQLFVVCNSSPKAYLYHMDGRRIATFVCVSNSSPFRCCAVSAHGRYVMFTSEEGKLYGFRTDTAAYASKQQPLQVCS